MIGQTVSHYKILEKLGQGGMGVVYLAEDTHLGRRVAVKFPSETAEGHNFRARFLREARAASALSHSNIAAIYDYGETTAETGDGRPFIVMELVRGQSLADLMHKGALSIRRAVEIASNVAEALSEAHERGVIHRDIKPSNVVISDRGEVKVLDFGLAKQIDESYRGTADPEARTLLATRTHSGTVLGTPLYLSPEQAKAADIDGRSDLFALGALLYECVAGRPAFSGAGILEIAAQVIHVDPPPPSSFNPEVPPELDRIVMKALAKKPEHRYQTAGEMLAELREVLGGLDETGGVRTRRLEVHKTGGSGAFTTLSETLRRPRLSLGTMLLLAALAGLLVWGVLLWWRPAPHKPPAEAQRWYESGTTALRDGAYYQASRAFEQAIVADGDFALAHARYAEALTELDYVDRAKDELLRVSALTPDRSVLPRLDSLYLDAVTSTVRRDFPRAVEAYEEIVRLAPNDSQVYVDLGRAYENNEDQKKAIESYVKATNLNQQYATAYLRVGVLYGRQQNQPSADAAFAKAESLYEALGNVEGRAEVLFQRGYLLRNMGKIAEAGPQLERALELARVASNPSQQIKTLLQLGYVALSEGSTGRAQQYARAAIDLAQGNGMENLTARGLIDLGNVFFARGDYPEAEKYFRQALEFAQRNKGRRNEARALLSLGSLRVQQINADEAVRYIEQALPFYQQGGYRKEASQALLLLGRANILKGDYEAALRAFEQQLQVAETVGDPSQLALSHEGIGTVLSLQERYGEALSHLEHRYQTVKSTNDQRGIAYALVGRASVLWQLGRYEEARAALDQASALANRPDGGIKALSTQILEVEAEVALSERDLPQAIARARQTLASAGTQYPDVAVGAKRVLGLAQALSGAAAEGKAACEESVEMAKKSGDPWQVRATQLALAQALLESNDAQGALTSALSLQESFARSGQQESEWRAWLIAARAVKRAGDEQKAREYAARAAELLQGLQRKWGDENYSTYLTRADVQHSRRQLSEEFGVGR